MIFLCIILQPYIKLPPSHKDNKYTWNPDVKMLCDRNPLLYKLPTKMMEASFLPKKSSQVPSALKDDEGNGDEMARIA